MMGTINKTNNISYEFHLLISITESILHNMLACYKGISATMQQEIFSHMIFSNEIKSLNCIKKDKEVKLSSKISSNLALFPSGN